MNTGEWRCATQLFLLLPQWTVGFQPTLGLCTLEVLSGGEINVIASLAARSSLSITLSPTNMCIILSHHTLFIAEQFDRSQNQLWQKWRTDRKVMGQRTTTLWYCIADTTDTSVVRQSTTDRYRRRWTHYRRIWEQRRAALQCPHVTHRNDTWRINMQCAFPGPTATRRCSCQRWQKWRTDRKVTGQRTTTLWYCIADTTDTSVVRQSTTDRYRRRWTHYRRPAAMHWRHSTGISSVSREWNGINWLDPRLIAQCTSLWRVLVVGCGVREAFTSLNERPYVFHENSCINQIMPQASAAGLPKADNTYE